MMKAYIGAKIVQAEPQVRIIFSDSGDEIIQAGYRVVYPDGYVSWSPKEVFEEAYRPLNAGEKQLVLNSTD